MIINLMFWAIIIAMLGFVGLLIIDDKMRKHYKKIRKWWDK